MNKLETTVILAFLLTLALCPSSARGQMVMGQYEEEAPLGTWNLFGAPGAAALGRGAALFAPSSADASVIFANPAQAARRPGLTVSLSGALPSASMFRYGPVNTGPISSDENLSLGTAAFEFAALTWSFRGWMLGMGAALGEVYDRPYVEAGASAYNALFTFSQEGYLRVWNVSLGREVFPGLSLGLGFNLVSGSWSWKMKDSWNPPSRAVIITDERKRELKGRYLNGGLLWRVSNRVSLSAAFRAPFTLSADSSSLLRYQAPAGGTDIQIEAAGEDGFRRPAVVGIGLAWSVRDDWSLYGEAGWWNWSSYGAEVMGGELPRDFRDGWRAAAGLEYRTTIRLFGQDFDIPSSLGLVHDSQPMKDPVSSYLGYALGMGVRWRALALDVGALFAFESGSGRRLVARRLAATLTVRTGRAPAGERT